MDVIVSRSLPILEGLDCSGQLIVFKWFGQSLMEKMFDLCIDSPSVCFRLWRVVFPLSVVDEDCAMEFAETGHCLGGLLRPVSLFMVFQALRLEWVKLMLDTSSSHLTHLFWPSRSSS